MAEVTIDGRVPVSEEVSTILNMLAGQANEALEQARKGEGDYLAAIEELGALLTLLAGGTWGASTQPESPFKHRYGLEVLTEEPLPDAVAGDLYQEVSDFIEGLRLEIAWDLRTT